MDGRLSAGVVVLVVVVGCYREERDEAQAEVARLTKDLAECSAALTAARETPEARFERATRQAATNWGSLDELNAALKEFAVLASVHEQEGVGPKAASSFDGVKARIAELEGAAKREREEAERLVGEPTDYLDFYSRGSGRGSASGSGPA